MSGWGGDRQRINRWTGNGRVLTRKGYNTSLLCNDANIAEVFFLLTDQFEVSFGEPFSLILQGASILQPFSSRKGRKRGEGKAPYKPHALSGSVRILLARS